MYGGWRVFALVAWVRCPCLALLCAVHSPSVAWVCLLQNIDIPGGEVKGTNVARRLLRKGYQGFVCIRSANDSDEDKALVEESGAHWFIDKQIPIRRMLELLQREYYHFLLQRGPLPPALEGRATPPHQALRSNTSSPDVEVLSFFGPS